METHCDLSCILKPLKKNYCHFFPLGALGGEQVVLRGPTRHHHRLVFQNQLPHSTSEAPGLRGFLSVRGTWAAFPGFPAKPRA